MDKDTFANRFQKAINLNNIKPIDLSLSTGIDKSVISSYLSGRYKPGEENLSILAKKLDVSEAWLQGYDVPIKITESNNKKIDELELLFSKTKDILNDTERDVIKTVMQNAIEKYENSKKG